MEEQNVIKQENSDVQYLQELRQRINEKAEKMIAFGMGSKFGWLAAFGILIVFEALSCYFGWIDDFWAFNAFVIASAVSIFIIYLVLRHYLAAMKKAGNAPQQYRAAKRFIRTEQMALPIILAVAFLAKDIVKTHGADFGAGLFASCFLIVLGIICFWVRPQSSIDKDFYNDVEELGEYK